MNDYLLIAYKTILFLVIILVIIRIMGKRELGELNVFDIIVSFMISEIFSNAISKPDENIFLSLLPIFIIFIVQILISYLVLKSHKIRFLIESKPSIIISNGTIDYKEMKKQRYNINDLLLQIREKGIEDIRKIEFAILEINGSLSVFTKDNAIYKYPFPLIIDGKIDKEVKQDLKINEEYILDELKSNNISLKEIFIAFIGLDNHLIFILKKWIDIDYK